MTCLETLPPPPLAESCIAVLETKRLVLRAPRLEDAKAIAAIANDRRIAENTARIPHPYRPADAEAWISSTNLNLEPGNETYVITLNGAIIGGCGFDLGEGPAPEIGYWLGAKYWGKGYATEAVRAVIAWGDQRFGVESRSLCLIHPENRASLRVAEKCGYRELRRVTYKNDPAIILGRLA